MREYQDTTNLLYAGKKLKGISLSPETLPIYATTAFTSRSLDEVRERYAKVPLKEDYSYIRASNPNRDALADIMTFLEHGEASAVTASGMGAITGTLLAVLQPGDHLVYSNCCYGEVLSAAVEIFQKFGVEITAVDIDDPDAVRAAVRKNTKVIYTEVIANPIMRVADIDAIAGIAHRAGALLVVDNTFTTPFAVRPLDHGADIVVNSLTKFLNGHSDVCAGSVTSTKELLKRIERVNKLSGTPCDPFTAWLTARALMTAELRVNQQMKNAYALAKALEQDPHVEHVLHPGIESFSGYETGRKLFRSPDTSSAMLSVDIATEDYEKRNAFTKALNILHYAPTLGGLRTTYQQPVYSSHSHMPDEERRKIGITPAQFRISVGIEDVGDVIDDFKTALRAID